MERYVDDKYSKYPVTYKDDPETRDMVFKHVVDWYFKHTCFSGECICQMDEPQIDAPIFLSDLAEDVLKFDVGPEE